MASPDFSYSSSRRRQPALSSPQNESADCPQQLHPVSESCGVRNTRARWHFPVWAIGGLLALVTSTVYWPATGYDFVNYDDNVLVTSNVHVQYGLTLASIKWALFNPVNCLWDPLTIWSHMLDCQLFGLNPWGHHLTNVVLHALNAGLVFALLLLLTGATWRSLMVAALFALHPLRVESVAWVAERKDVLSGFFGLLALIAYARYAQGQGQSKVQSLKSKVQSAEAEGSPKSEVRSPKPEAKDDARSSVPGSMLDVGCWMLDVQSSMFDVPPSPFHLPSSIFYLLSLMLFTLGLMSKPMLVTWPFVMLLLDYWPLRRFELSTLNSQLSTILRLAREKLPFFALAIAASVVTWVAQKQQGALTLNASLPLAARGGNAIISYCRYLGKMFWPMDLAVLYPHPGDWPLAKVLLAGGLLVGISVLLFAQRRRYPFLLMGWLWFLGALVPVIQLLQTGGHAMADRYTYLPSLGMLVLAIWGAGELTRGWRHQALALTVASSAVIVLCVALTRQQLGYWKDSEALFRHALEVTRNNYIAHKTLGDALEQKGQTDEAIRQYQEALRLRPDYAEAHYNLGIAFLRKGQTDDAINQYRAALRLNPEYPEAHNNLGNALVQKGQTEEAIRHYQAALRSKPDYAPAHSNLDYLLTEYPESLGAMAGALDAQGEYAKATQFYQAALKAQPDQEEVLNNLAWLLATCPDAAFRNGPEAVRLATRACELTGYTQPLLIGTLAAAQAEAGDFPAAIATAERAAALAKSLHLEDIAARNRELLQLYRQNLPFHEKKGSH